MESADRITSIQIYQFDNPRGLHYGTCEEGQCQYGLLKITCGEHAGWAKCILAANVKSFDLVQWASFLQYFRRPTLNEAYDTVKRLRDRWGMTKSEFVLEALNDLENKLLGKANKVPLDIDPSCLSRPEALIVNCLAHYENL